MFPQLGTEMAKVKLSKEKKESEDFAKELVGRELKAANATNAKAFRGSGGSSKIRWYLSKEDSEHHQKVLRLKFEQKKRQFTTPQLEGAFESYLQDRYQSALDKDADRWMALMHLSDVIRHDPVAEGVRLSGGDFAAYELFFRCEPRTHICRARFMIAMRKIFGFQTAELDRVSDGAVVKLLERVYDVFDDQKIDKLDWRTWLVMYALLSKYEVMTREHFVWGFSMYASHGSIDLETTQAVPFTAIRAMFHFYTDENMRGKLMEAVDIAFDEVVESSTELNIAVRQLMREGRVSQEVPIKLNHFKALLDTPSMAPMFEPGRPFGSRDSDTWTLAIEEDYMHPTLLLSVKTDRRKLRNHKKMMEFIETSELRCKRFNMESWARYVIRRKRCRYLMAECIVRYHVENVSMAMNAWTRFAIADIRAITIQRCIRGWLGRTEAHFLWFLHHCATVLQTRYRMVIAVRRYIQRQLKRKWAATEMQRHFRGNMHRRLAFYRLSDFIAHEREKLDKERWNWENRTLIKATIAVQRAWRKREARLAAEEAERKRKAELSVEQMMVEQEIEQQRQRKIYEENLEKWFDEQRAEAQKNQMYDDFSKAEKDKIVRYRRQEAEKERKRRMEQNKKREELMEEQRVENWLVTWNQTQVTRADEKRKYLEQCLHHPETKEEKHVRRELIKEIKKHTKAVLKRADEQKVEMEYLEGYEIATDEIMIRHMDEEKEKVYHEMREAAEKYEIDKAEEKRILEEEQEHARQNAQVYSANLLQGMVKKSQARKKLRELVYKVFKKEFDPPSFTFTYVDQRNDHVIWHKPYSLGSYEMKCRDEWVRCLDSTGVEYFYNPLSMKMQWVRPLGTVQCVTCEIEFAKRYCNENHQLQCVECWTKGHAHLTKPRDRIKLSWKELDGGMESSEAALTEIDDFPDHSEAEKGLISADDNTDAELAKKIAEKLEAHKMRVAVMIQGSSAETAEEKKAKQQYVKRMQNQKEAARKRVTLEQAQAGVAQIIDGEWKPKDENYPCAICNDGTTSERFCNQCDLFYCIDCFTEAHDKHGPLRTHTFHNVSKEQREKINKQFEWPDDRPPSEGISNVQAWVEAQSLMKTGTLTFLADDDQSVTSLDSLSTHGTALSGTTTKTGTTTVGDTTTLGDDTTVGDDAMTVVSGSSTDKKRKKKKKKKKKKKNRPLVG